MPGFLDDGYVVQSSVKWALILFIGLGYLVLVRTLRFRRRDGLARKYGYTTRQALSGMTLEDAFAIQHDLISLEFPTVFSTSVSFALYKTYGIPSISKLLVETGELANEKSTSKRAADTGVLLTEIVLHGPNSQRTLQAIARMNFLHNRYRRAGKISDQDMLYTLSLFVLEPIRWTNRLEWRPLSDIERCAMGTYWKELGEAMEIPYTHLKSDTWQDGLQWLEELEEWSTAYEKTQMVPAHSNKRLSDGTIELAISKQPAFLQNQVRQFIPTLLEPRLRTAVMLDSPSWLHQMLVDIFFSSRRVLLRYFHLPKRPGSRKRWQTNSADPKTGRYHRLRYSAHPWYIKPTFASRWKPKAWLAWATGRAIPGDAGDTYYPAGYHIPDVGPRALEGKGRDEMDKTVMQLSEARIGACPFRGSHASFLRRTSGFLE